MASKSISVSSVGDQFLPLVRVSLLTGPLLDIVARHVPLDAKTRKAIERDLAAAAQTPAQGRSLTAIGDDEILSTEAAAQLLGVSRPHVVKLIDSGALPMHQRVGNQRRVLKSAVLGYRANERSRQMKALKRLGDDLDDELTSS